MNIKIDEYLINVGKWRNELEKLRNIIVECGLQEEFKWMHPCYTFQNNNIVLIHEFKNYCAILFHKGVLLKDPENILVQQTVNVQSARQIRFTSISEIDKYELTIMAYISEAIEIEKSGVKITKKKTEEFTVPKELELKFEENSGLKIAFEKLTPGRQKGYLLHFSQAKQSNTRTSRIEKNINRILDGKGLRDCVCGLSKKMPICDGSHKYINNTNKKYS